MKKVILSAFIALNFTIISAQAQNNTTVLHSEAIDVDGFMAAEKKPTDNELETVKAEVARQKKEIILNREKAKQFQTLSKSVEKLSETTEEYLEEKRAAKDQIAEYNAKVKCLQIDNPGPECDKFVRRR